MKQYGYLLAAACIFSGSTHASAGSCPIPGELAHWRADFCLAEAGTDDVVAVSACLERELQIRFRSPCNGKYRYKGAMCKLAVEAGSYSGTARSCVEDPLFVGPTVRSGAA